MRESQLIREEYQQLKGRLEGRIAEMESKSSIHSKEMHSPHRSTSAHNIRCPSLSHLQHHCPGCHQACHHGPLPYQQHYSINTNTTLPRVHNSLDANDILAENLLAQREINENLKALSERISDLSVRRSSEVNIFDEARDSRLADEINEKSTRYNAKIGHGARTRSLIGNLRRASHLSQEKSHKNREQGRKTQWIAEDRNGSEYYAHSQHSDCHSKCKIKGHQEIYRDAQHRNRKHQKEHLMQCFKKQEKSRKELLAKIALNFFNNYGVK